MIAGLDDFVRQINELGEDRGITVFVGGALISGYLTPCYFWVRWNDEASHRTRLGGGRFKIPTAEPLPIPNQEERDKAIAWYKEQPFAEDPDAIPPLTLRDPVILQGLSAVKLPFLELDLEAVAAWLPAHTTLANP